MFESLSEKLEAVFRRLRGHGKLSEKNMEEALREVRLALLEADVNFRVVKDFVERIKSQALGQEVLASLSPAQQVIKIVNIELVALLGGQYTELNLSAPPPGHYVGGTEWLGQDYQRRQTRSLSQARAPAFALPHPG